MPGKYLSAHWCFICGQTWPCPVASSALRLMTHSPSNRNQQLPSSPLGKNSLQRLSSPNSLFTAHPGSTFPDHQLSFLFVTFCGDCSLGTLTRKKLGKFPLINVILKMGRLEKKNGSKAIEYKERSKCKEVYLNPGLSLALLASSFACNL